MKVTILFVLGLMLIYTIMLNDMLKLESKVNDGLLWKDMYNRKVSFRILAFIFMFILSPYLFILTIVKMLRGVK